MARSEESKKNYKNLNVEVPKEFNDYIIETAKMLGVSKSDLVRIALRNYLPKVREENAGLITINKEINERIGI